MSDVSNLEVQLNELEMLMSMFPGSNEIEFDDPSELADLRALVDAADPNICGSNSIGFTIHLLAEQVSYM
jgi:hypothetical protein